jgi:predicted transcriptional regulator
MEITHWHRNAQLYLNGELTMPEIVKLWIINTAIGIIEDDTPFVGYNVLDNSELHDGLTVSLISHFPKGESISYTEIGKLLGYHPNTIANAVKRLVEKGYISKEEQGRAGTYYTVHTLPRLPLWMTEFTRALVQLYTDADLKERVVVEVQNIGFKRGLEALQAEIRDRLKHSR